MRSLRQVPLASLWKINMHLLLAFFCALGAWWLWPSSGRDLGFGLASLILGGAAISGIIRASVEIYVVRSLMATVGNMVATHRAPEPSRLADDDALKKAGML